MSGYCRESKRADKQCLAANDAARCVKTDCPTDDEETDAQPD